MNTNQFFNYSFALYSVVITTRTTEYDSFFQLQVDSCKKVASQIKEVPESQREVTIGMENVKDQESCTTERLAETECLLITKADVTSDNEQFVVTYHDIAVFGRPVPYIAIPE